MKLVKNEIGYYEISPKPTPEYLSEYYNQKYWGNKEEQGNPRSGEYTQAEIDHRIIAIDETLQYVSKTSKKLLEAGFGEGFFLNYFYQLGWDIEGVDFTDHGLMQFHPHLREKVVISDLFLYIDQILNQGKTYDLVICNNVIEHIINPVSMLEKFKNLLTKDGICRIVVPNDGSWLQHEVISKGYADQDFWVAAPDHLNYFNVDSFRKVLELTGLEIIDLLGEFPVDIFLLNSHSNYMSDRSKGKEAHFARIGFENTLHQRSPQALTDFRRSCASAGIGRDIIAYCRRKAN